jgi:hypothetical protein
MLMAHGTDVVRLAERHAIAHSARAARHALIRGRPLTATDLRGAIDIHVHTAPDSRARSLDAVEAARQAKAAGMRAIVLKNHYEFTSGWAYLNRTIVPGIEVFGGVDLNRSVGGINVAAVEYMEATTGGFGRIVWMPTFDSENQVRYSKESRPFVSVSRRGELLPAVKEVIASIAKHDLVLATGHSSPEEVLLLLSRGSAARRQAHGCNPRDEPAGAYDRRANAAGCVVGNVLMKSAYPSRTRG